MNSVWKIQEKGHAADNTLMLATTHSCRYCNLFGQDLHGRDFRNMDFSYANLAETDLSNVRLGGAKLDHASLYKAKLESANLEGASLKSANLTKSCIDGANLRKADLTDALLYGQRGCALDPVAYLDDANLSNTKLAEALYQTDIRGLPTGPDAQSLKS